MPDESAPDSSPPEPTPLPLARRWREVAGLFTRLGFTAFGGPPVHIAMMEGEVVTRRRWIDRQHFLDLVAAINFIPGPNSTELAIHLGLLRAGPFGLLTAGVCFITPAVLIILPIACAYVTYGRLPVVSHAMSMIHCAVVAVVALATWRFLRSSVTSRFTAAVAVASGAITLALSRYPKFQPELIVLALAAACGAIYAWTRRASAPPPQKPSPPSAPHQMGGAATLLLPAALAPVSATGGFVSLATVFLTIGATLFGSGYVLISYLRSSVVVEHNWLSEQQLLDAVSVGQFTPGPLLTTATFVGYVAGHGALGGGHAGGIVGAVIATVAIFLPSFVFVALAAPVLQRIRRHPLARGALDAMNAAVAALLGVVCVQIGTTAFSSAGALGAIITCISLAALWRNVNATWVILAAGALGAWLGRAS